MPEDHIHSSTADSELQDLSNIVKVATDRLAIERAYQLIDSYVEEVWRQQPSPFNSAQLKWPAPERAA